MGNETILAGQVELAIGANVIPPYFLGDITPEFTEMTREITTLGGTRTQPAGTFETSTLTFSMYLPSMDYLKNVFADEYNAGSGTQESGNLVFGSGTCTTKSPVPVNVHYICDDTDDNDLHIFAGLVAVNYNPSYNNDDGLMVEVVIYAQPSAEGLYRLGTGDISQPSIYDAATQTTVPVTP